VRRRHITGEKLKFLEPEGPSENYILHYVELKKSFHGGREGKRKKGGEVRSRVGGMNHSNWYRYKKKTMEKLDLMVGEKSDRLPEIQVETE